VTETGTRADRKERTRRAILDAALRLSAETTLAGLSLRQVAKEVGIVPTAFYRHFPSLEELGLALVDESFQSLRRMLRDVRRAEPTESVTEVADRSVDVLAQHVRTDRAHFAFIARERSGQPGPVRDAIRHEIELCERELATDLALLPGARGWTGEDLRVLSALIVTSMVSTAEALLDAERPEREEEVAHTARTQLRMMLVGALHWRSAPLSG
jgi:AcrR family transcriptional regulator